MPPNLGSRRLPRVLVNVGVEAARQSFRPGEFTDREDSSDRVMPGDVECLDSD